mmetsp:Transcript_103404/g.183696  ORF Transcript_103404/g.183696 Transcript_103404/m.183696 type:complete len:671 (+) Transcript_103404:108-2120(+)|eukprot:CAMPEP_0197622284 /NCGR_PEP_ID=MMETSP1338-20131121/2644_1 /TAXON_ID=43686 ORGANISM="Pelagodinium beii, Strain RCC1491" /NCGR_SAMPLE_ID=MMETSP1338 /ASSEMBLY_ACC=CAM_ASM_000754 /LENGTH=670 /DNA_ID=CAMNT_0043191995 /DNA_START=102 /DNA_END=2114 /DNA_ORIENTATION=-
MTDESTNLQHEVAGGKTPPVLLGRSGRSPVSHTPKSVKRTSTSVQRHWMSRMRKSAEDLESLETGSADADARCEKTAITFQDVSFSARGPSGEEKQILAPMSGHWESGNLVAVMGPSGCGKSTLLDILAEKKSAAYSGTIHFNGRPRDKLFRRISAYVPQEDVMPAHLTVLESVLFCVALKNERPSMLTNEATLLWAHRRLEVLGLDGIKDSWVGDGSTLRGISGGQKRRLSLARRLVSGAHIFFCDEPTSGLSATDAEACVRYMRHAAHFYNVLVIVVIHQPRVEVANLFDELLLMTANPGRAVYSGKMADAQEHWQTVGFPVPSHVNPVDHYMDLVTPGAPGEACEAFLSHFNEHCKTHLDKMVRDKLHEELKSPLELLEHVRENLLVWGDLPPLQNQVYGVPFGRQLKLVSYRLLLLRLRDKKALLAELISAVAKAIVVGIVYMRTGELTAQQQIAFYFMLCMTISIDGLKNMPTIIGERTVVKMEASESLYSEWAYIIAFAFAGLVQGLVCHSIFVTILFAMTGLRWALLSSVYLWSTLLSIAMDGLYLMVAAAAKDATTAIVMSSPFLMLFLLFNGYTTTRSSVVIWMRWAVDISPVAYSIQQITISAATVYSDDTNLTNGYQYEIERSGFSDQPLVALSVCIACIVIFRTVQVICFIKLNNIQR